MSFESDRRGSRRIAASGRVEIWIDHPVPSNVAAELIESSATGFRASHHSTFLEPGLEVRYRTGASSGRARVIWTHVFQDRHVSGFFLL
jgi:hypothetical protein